MVRHDGAAAEGLGQRGVVVLARGAHDDGVVRRLRGADVPGELELPGLPQQPGNVDPRLGRAPSVADDTAWIHAGSKEEAPSEYATIR